MGRGAARLKDGRAVDGILLLSKPLGISSNQALQKVRALFRANKAGHTGSLDPLATGLLPICFGEATKFSQYLLNSSKSYRASCQLGQTTTTGDAEGALTSKQPVSVSAAQVARTLEQFSGRIEQVPPMYSALKFKGQRLYTLARDGQEVTRAARTIEIHALQMLSFENDRLVLDVHCSKGTYIRTLAEDIGKALGCGAYLTDLERTGVHPFWQQPQYGLEALRSLALDPETALEDCLLPVESALSDFPPLIIHSSAVDSVQQGQTIQVDSDLAPGLSRLTSESGQFIGLGEVFVGGRVVPKRLLNTANSLSRKIAGQ